MAELAEPAATVEQFDRPTCAVLAGNTCRARGGKVANVHRLLAEVDGNVDE